MRKYFIRTFGCKTNQYESELIKQLLKDKNELVVDNYCEADVVVINSCAVTQSAERDVYKFIRRVYRENKNVNQILLVGCYAEYIKQQSLYNYFFERLSVKIPVVFLGNQEKYNFIQASINEFDCGIKKFFGEKRAYVKIQEGCNNYCSYCIVPYLRSLVRSKPLKIVLNEIQNLISNGYTEIYLVGTNIGKYYYTENCVCYDYVDLSKEILSNFKNITLLYSSLEPVDLNKKFFEFINEYKTKIFPHFHIPLQSADDDILCDMNRKYTVDEYENKINYLRKLYPDVIISTDLIVGYPLETKQKFYTTLEFIKKIKFNWIHVFPYSPRIGTKAYYKYDKFSCYDSKLRVRIVNSINCELGEKYFKQLCKVI
ncbi:MAG: MiaB/RimO family radical SAM methylthiotransferase [Endomicrobia bacterium]|nr:MiaB/RimO family radical SAM methylthiotransferase [Endomicrobiia bacterium]